MKKTYTIISNFVKRHKKLTVFTASVIFLWVVLSPFVAINFPDFDLAENCFSVALDKWQMNSVDKIVYCTPNKETEITDKKLIKKFIKETTVADSAGYGVSFGYYNIKLYNGDKLIRELRQSDTFPLIIEIYKKDKTHWVFQKSTDVGTVNISEDLFYEIKSVLETDGIFLPDP